MNDEPPVRRDAKVPRAEVIGCPIAHSRSPAIHGFWLAACGIVARYEACHVMPAELVSYLGVRRHDEAWRGCNVTLPHKQTAALVVDALDRRAAAIGATNTIVRVEDGSLVGGNTDVDGIAEALAGAEAHGPAVVIGAGGAARAAFVHLAATGRETRVLARDPVKARRAAAECGLAANVLPLVADSGAFADAAVVINATQLGMDGQPPMPDFVLAELAGMSADGLVFDMVYAPLRTALLVAAEREGRKSVDGLTMLIGQAATAFARFFGRPPPREDDARLRRMLT